MGIDIGSALVVGLPYEDVYEAHTTSGDSCAEYSFDDWLDDKHISRFSPYYDANYQDCVFGFKVAGTDYTYDELEDNYADTIDRLRSKFYKLTGKVAKVYVTADVW